MDELAARQSRANQCTSPAGLKGGHSKEETANGHIAANSADRLHPPTMTTPTSQFLWLQTYLSHERRGEEGREVACQSGGGTNPHIARHRRCRSKCIRVLISRGSGGGLWVGLLDPTTSLRGRKRGKRHLHMLMHFPAVTHQPFPVVLLSSPSLKSLALTSCFISPNKDGSWPCSWTMGLTRAAPAPDGGAP